MTPVTTLSDSELHEAADQVARRIVASKKDQADSFIVIELSNRLLRAAASSGAIDARSLSYELLGVIADAKAGRFNAVCIDTLVRVASSLASPKEAPPAAGQTKGGAS